MCLREIPSRTLHLVLCRSLFSFVCFVLCLWFDSGANATCSLTKHKMSDGGRGRALLGVKVRKSSQKWSVRRSAVRSIAWLGLCGFIGGRGATIGAQLHNKFFAIIAIAHILSCKLESAFL